MERHHMDKSVLTSHNCKTLLYSDIVTIITNRHWFAQSWWLVFNVTQCHHTRGISSYRIVIYSIYLPVPPWWGSGGGRGSGGPGRWSSRCSCGSPGLLESCIRGKEEGRRYGCQHAASPAEAPSGKTLGKRERWPLYEIRHGVTSRHYQEDSIRSNSCSCVIKWLCVVPSYKQITLDIVTLSQGLLYKTIFGRNDTRRVIKLNRFTCCGTEVNPSPHWINNQCMQLY